jgi:ubiquinone/menaquinone biosynthesis C-methylase UbiE
MPTVNYTDIALRYDKNPIRSQIEPDQTLEQAGGLPWHILDVGCGTGSYIQSQAALPGNKNIRWYGIDPNEKMLSIAKAKVPFAEFYPDAAENLRFSDSFFDYVTSRFSLHHFRDLQRALQEIHRVLKPEGFFKIVNLVPELSPNWWVYRYFPDAQRIDTKRFLSIDELQQLAAEHGFHLDSSQFELRQKIKAELVVNEARNRETTELILIDETHYKTGLKKLESELLPLGESLVDWGLMIGKLTFTKS